MGRLYIPTDNRVDGPWLLGHEKLETLNILFGEVDAKLAEALAKTIDRMAKQEVEEGGLELAKVTAKLQKKYGKKLKSAEITFDDGNTYEAEDIEGILNYVDTNPSLAPTELYISTVRGNSENEFSLIINSNAGKEEVEFEYRIRCIDEEVQQKIKSLIDKWVRENKSHPPLQVWSNTIVYLIYFVCSFSILIAWANLSETTTKAGEYQLELKRQAQQIIEKGVSQVNVDSTLLLLLKLQADYVPDNVREETIEIHSTVASKFLVVSIIILAISIIRPKTVIGVGRKQRRLKLYQIWITVTYGTIALLAGALITDGFMHFIKW